MSKPEGPPNTKFTLTGDVRFAELALVAAVCLVGALAGLAVICWKTSCSLL